MLPFCWSDLALHRIEATIAENNIRSLRLAERLGLVYEGTRRDGARINGRWRNLRVYSALASDRQFAANPPGLLDTGSVDSLAP